MPGVRVSDVISPLSPSDTYPVIDVDVNAKGFARIVSSVAQRDAIPASLRSTSMFVILSDTREMYRWSGAIWVLVGYITSTQAQHTHVSETPTGVIDGTNGKFSLSQKPIAGSLLVFRNGLLQRPGASNDYVDADTEIQFNAGVIPQINDILYVQFAV